MFVRKAKSTSAIGYNASMMDEEFASLAPRLQQALDARLAGRSPNPDEALRLFSGFYEGEPDLVIDLYARTLLLWDYSAPSPDRVEFLNRVQSFYLERLPWVDAVVRKIRLAPDAAQRRGVLTHGKAPAAQVCEHGVWYALALILQQDASFYLDTRQLRRWLLERASGWQVLNTFAYTGSLGIAALAGGAAHVLQADRSRKFLDLARQSAALNRLDLGRMKLAAGDFFRQVSSLKRSGALFDCVILDPPFFSTSHRGAVDQLNASARLINKVRPLVKDGGFLVAVNNALFLSGAAYYASLQALCQDGYLEIEALIPAPADITGYPHTVAGSPPAPPAPFNHATKIAVLRVRRR
jgi:23S rRNA (cytosine1962-C5)-methyltransferase